MPATDVFFDQRLTMVGERPIDVIVGVLQMELVWFDDDSQIVLIIYGNMI